MSELKAYEVSEDGEGHSVVVFSTNGAAARREGGNKLDLSFEEVESCRRVPAFDSYAPGPVPPLVLIEHGWWFECFHCGRWVSDDMADGIADEGLDPDDFVPRETANRHGVFCSAACEAMHAAEERTKPAVVDALIETFEAKYPGAKVESVHGWATVLGNDDRKAGCPYTVTFTFPGGKYSGNWKFGDDKAFVAQCDVEAFHAWRRS